MSAAMQWLEMHFIMRMTMSEQGTRTCFAISQQDIVCTNVDHACIRHLGINESITTTTILGSLVNKELGPYPDKFCLLENENDDLSSTVNKCTLDFFIILIKCLKFEKWISVCKMPFICLKIVDLSNLCTDWNRQWMASRVWNNYSANMQI